jgi:hypothetical protein
MKHENIYENIEAGLFNLQEFIGYPAYVVNDYFKSKGWKSYDCFNDYKYAWINCDLNKSIIAKVDMADDEIYHHEVINSIWWFDGIYKETH